MNKNCYKIGLKNTRFTNPTGLSDIGNYSTARDLAKLIAFCMKNHLLSLIFKKKVYTCTAVNERLGLERYQIPNLDLFNGKIQINIYFQFEIVSE